VETIDILHRHLYREPDENDIDIPAFSFSRSDIMAVISEHESLQRLGDQRVLKRRLEDDLEAYAAVTARKADKQRRALQRNL
jgi:transcriptional regulator